MQKKTPKATPRPILEKAEEISDRLPSQNQFKHPARMSPQSKASRNYVKVLFQNPIASLR
jgi:hypothetical protein